MGGRPIVLTLAEARYYHGKIIEDLFLPFCRPVATCEEVTDAVRESLDSPPRGLSEEERHALARSFGEVDGHNADRFVQAVTAYVASLGAAPPPLSDARTG